MGWYADMDDVEFTIEPPIEEEDRNYLMKQILKQCDLNDVVDNYYSEIVTEDCLDYYNQYITKMKKDDPSIKSLFGWILKDWSTIIFSYDSVKYGEIKLEQLTKIVSILSKRGYVVNGNLHYTSEEQFGYYLKIVDNKMYELEIDISAINMEKIIESYIDNQVKSPSKFRLLNRKQSVEIKQ